MIGNVQIALQAFVTTGYGETLVLREPRSVTFSHNRERICNRWRNHDRVLPQAAPDPGTGSGCAMVWTALNTIAVPANKTTEWDAGSVSGTFRARISTPVTGGTVTVLAIRPEEQKG